MSRGPAKPRLAWYCESCGRKVAEVTARAQAGRCGRCHRGGTRAPRPLQRRPRSRCDRCAVVWPQGYVKQRRDRYGCFPRNQAGEEERWLCPPCNASPPWRVAAGVRHLEEVEAARRAEALRQEEARLERLLAPLQKGVQLSLL